MSTIINFWVNGKIYCSTEKISLLQLIEYLDYKNSLLVLEYNKLICDKLNWQAIFISDNDKIEIVTLVGGG